jgi:hypothetical protein
LHRIEDAEDVELPFLGQVRRVGEESKGYMHGRKVTGRREAGGRKQVS